MCPSSCGGFEVRLLSGRLRIIRASSAEQHHRIVEQLKIVHMENMKCQKHEVNLKWNIECQQMEWQQ